MQSQRAARLRRNPGHGSARPRALACGAAAGLCGAPPALAAESPETLATAMFWLLAVVFGLVCAAAGAYWGRRRQQRALVEARLERQLLTQWVDGWIWQTDARGALSAWRPPAGASASQWSDTTALQQPLWDSFGADPVGAEALRARLEAQVPLTDLRLQRHGSTGAQPWRLRGAPRFDADGHFAGYQGLAVPVAADEQRRYAEGLLAHLWPAIEDSVVALRREPGSTQWQVQAMNAPAAALFADARGWDELAARLPAGLAARAGSLGNGETAIDGGWTLQLHHFGNDADTPAGRLLLLRAARTEPSEQAAAAAADQESFAYTISHDLRAPIRVVEGFARIVKEDYGRFLDRIGNDHLDRVLAAAARMNSMIDALLALTRLQSQPLARKPVDLSQLATYIVEDLRREQPERKLELAIEAGIVVEGDPTLLRVAMENLIGNAWKYSAQNEVAHIEFRRMDPGPPAKLLVADNGAGFDMRFADRLFGVFQRLHSAKDFQGTGVGLATVRRIVRRHGGEIWAESEVGKGARFYFTLP